VIACQATLQRACIRAGLSKGADAGVVTAVRKPGVPVSDVQLTPLDASMRKLGGRGGGRRAAGWSPVALAASEGALIACFTLLRAGARTVPARGDCIAVPASSAEMERPVAQMAGPAVALNIYLVYRLATDALL
jgi:hypothetical protein